MGSNMPGEYSSKSKKISAIRRILRQFIRDDIIEPEDEDISLVRDIEKARNDWLNACLSYEYAKDQVIIDYYIYNMKACQIKYEYLLSIAKERGLKLEQSEAKSITAVGK